MSSSSPPATDPSETDDAPDERDGVEGAVADRAAIEEQEPVASAAGMNQPRVLRGESYRSCLVTATRPNLPSSPTPSSSSPRGPGKTAVRA